jgi:hypothetical protein
MAHAPLPPHVEDRVHAVGKQLGLDTHGNSEHRRLALNVVARAHGVGSVAQLARQHANMHDGVRRPVGKPGRYGWDAQPGGRRRGR